MDVAATLPYSTANTKGQCIRHPTIQLKQKKTFGSGYKTITSICPMCAMELMSIEGNDHQEDCGGRDVGHEVVSSSSTSVTGWDASSIQASAQRSNSSRATRQQQQHHRSSRSRRHSKQRSDDVSIKSAPSTYNRESRHHHRQPHHESTGTNNNIESTSSFGHSSRSCGSHRGPTTNINKQYYSVHEIPSCDSTLDMSLSVSSRFLSSRSSSQGGGSSRCSNASSSSSAASYTSSHSGQSHRSNNNSHHCPPQQQEEYVCGLQYNNGYYTGQIDIDTQLPHGLGSLRDRQGVICNEGQWHYGRLVESSLPSSCGSTNTSSYDPRQHDAYTRQQEKKTSNFEQYIVSSNEEDESSSACSTVHTDDEDSSIPSVALSSQSSSSSWSSSRHSSSSSTTRRLHSPSSPKYSARESKNTTLSLVPQDKFRSFSRTSSQARTSVATNVSTVPQAAAAGNQVAYNKLQEYQNYIDMCDDNEDWYLENQTEKEEECYGGERIGSRRVRFREDP